MSIQLSRNNDENNTLRVSYFAGRHINMNIDGLHLEDSHSLDFPYTLVGMGGTTIDITREEAKYVSDEYLRLTQP
ncbi:MAG TPA: hypothetical protein VK172_10430 [Lentimicrobium sp.]|nr:hypothetical protein [Lentimicrobium sp.]